MQLTTLSRLPIRQAIRYQLPRKENDFFTQRFYFQRAVLETQFNDGAGKPFVVLNTHFDAWTAGTDLSEKQVNSVMKRLNALEQKGIPWILGGDFNVLPPDNGQQWEKLKLKSVFDYNPHSEVTALYKNYNAIPSLDQLTQKNAEQWYTYRPNSPDISKPDRTIDYIFYSHHWIASKASVLQKEAELISDHFPILASFSRVDQKQ
jgi:endonuclease/exonuclease/phosphatase family metal-dependent hydrolase